MLFCSPAITCFSEEKAGSDPASTPRPETKAPAAEAAAKGEFIIGSGDVLNVFVWKEPEVSKTVPVRPDGKISLPLLNDIQASGLTAMQLKAELEQRLSKFFADPVVTITVETINSQKVTIMGEVTEAGSKPLAGPTRVLDMIATAGLTPFSKTTKIYILRNADGKVSRFGFNYKDYIKGKNPNKTFF